MRYADNHCKYIENYDPEHTYTFLGECLITGKEVIVTVKAEELYLYRQGYAIQDAFKSLTADEREFLKSGISAEGWDEIFDEPEGI